MAITPTVTALGSAAASPTGTTITNTVTSTVPIGTPIFAVMLCAGATTDVHTFSDSVGSKWTTDVYFKDPVDGTALSLGSARTAGDLASGVGTVTCTLDHTETNRTIFPFMVQGSGIILPPTVDARSGVNAGFGTSATPGSTKPNQPGDFGINVIVDLAGPNGSAGTPPAGWTELLDSTDAAGFAFIQINYTTTLLADVTPLNPIETIGSNDWYDVLVLYQAPPGRTTEQHPRHESAVGSLVPAYGR